MAPSMTNRFLLVIGFPQWGREWVRYLQGALANDKETMREMSNNNDNDSHAAAARPWEL